MTLWYCFAAVSVFEIVVSYLFEGNSRFRQCIGDCIFWNNDKPLFTSGIV